MSNKKITIKHNFSLKKEILKYINYWKWFAFSLLTSLLLAVLFLIIKNPIFNNKTTILIKETEESRGISELAAFKDFNTLEGNNDKNDEIEIINSTTLIKKVVDSLKLNIVQEATIDFRTVDIYDITPIKVDFSWNKIGYRKKIKTLKKIIITLVDDNNFIIDYQNENIDEQQYKYGTPINLKQGVLTISKSVFFEANKSLKEDLTLDSVKKINITIHPSDYYAAELQKGILVAAKTKTSNVLDISIKNSNRSKANHLLDNLIYQYNKDAMADKNKVAYNTDIFLSKRLNILSRELDSVEKIKVLFKKNNSLTDIQKESELFIKNITESENKLVDLEIQHSLTRLILNYLTLPNKKNELLPVNVGINNSSIGDMILDYNKLVLEKNKLLSENSTELNPLVVSLNKNINANKLNLLESLKNEINNINLTKNDYKKQEQKIKQKISSIPGIEKDYINIERQQNSKQNLYLYLLKKKEENDITMSVVTPVAKIIDKSNSSNKPTFPKPIMILMFALLIGLTLPFSIIYVLDILNTKVNTLDEIKEIMGDIPIMGETIKLKKNESDVITKNDRSVLGETFRIIRTNINYFLSSKKRESKAFRIFVTSSIKGEGKTFVSFNVMLSLVDSNKKTIIIGGDIRNPKLSRYTKKNIRVTGLTNYLNDKDTSLKSIINTVNFADRDFDVIESGIIPPNPSELLLNHRFEELLSELETIYDYIIIDTAPTMLVTDTFLINKTADLNLYIIRSSYSEKDLLPYIKDLNENKRINNMGLVLNDVKKNKSGYGYGYGYGNDINKKWYQFY